MEIILRRHALLCGKKGLETALPSFKMCRMQSRSTVSGELGVTVGMYRKKI